MIPVIRQHYIVGMRERPDHRHLAEFLTEASMCRARHKPPAELCEDELLSSANQVAESIQTPELDRDNRLAVRVTLKASDRGNLSRTFDRADICETHDRK